MGSLWRTKFYPTLLERDVAKISIHKSFDPTSRSHENDVAILRFVTALPQKAVDIGPIEIRNNNNTNGLTGYVSSWGDTNKNMPTEFSDALMKINVEVSTADKCRTLVGSLSPGQICVTTRVIGSTCYGDLGAPFVSDGKLIGFVSEEKACTEKAGQPIILTSAAYHKKWIDANGGMNLKSLSSVLLIAISILVTIIRR